MSLLSRLLPRRPLPAAANGQWQRILVPGVEQPYSARALQVAFRLAQGSGATVQLAFLLEVPRVLPLEAALPDAEAVAAGALHVAEHAAIPYKVSVESAIHRTRNTHDRILSLIPEAGVDLLVLGARPDRLRGLPGDMARELFLAAPCEVIVDYIANEK